MDYMIHVGIVAVIFAIMSLSLNVLTGFTGLPSLCHAAFAGIGAYTSALLSLRMGLPPVLTLPAAMGMAAALAAVLGRASVRVRNDYMALVTFGFAVLYQSLARNWVELTRGPMGLTGVPAVTLFGYTIQSPAEYLLLAGALLALTWITLRVVVKSPFGRLLCAMRDNEAAVRSAGKDVDAIQVRIFATTAAFAGLAGALYAHYITYVDPDSFSALDSLTVLLMVVFGGLGSLLGSVVGAVVLVTVPELLRLLALPPAVAGPVRQMFYGVLLMSLVLLGSRGLLGRYRWM